MVNGIVAEIKGNASVDLLQSGTPGYLAVRRCPGCPLQCVWRVTLLFFLLLR